jgi:YkoY family integral membrane protein
MTEISLVHALTIIGTLILLEGLLSADNALVLALLVKHLPKVKRQKALLYGLIGAFGFRFIMLLAAVWIVKLWYLSAAGAAYLAYLAVAHFVRHAGTTDAKVHANHYGFWRTVVAVEFTDVAFAIDSVMVAVALSNELWIIFLGGALGIVAMRFAAGGFVKLLERYPGFEHTAYALIAWVSVKMFVQSYGMFSGDHRHLSAWVFWSGMGIIGVGGTIWAMLKPAKTSSSTGGEPEEVTGDLPNLGPNHSDPKP